MQVGLIGLGKMGGSVARRLMKDGHDVIGVDGDSAALTALADTAMQPAGDIYELVAQLPAPRIIWLMVPAGPATQQSIDKLAELLSDGDLIVDGGNSYYRDTLEQNERLAAKGIHLVDAGTSGGVAGLTHGFCLMVGGHTESIVRLEPLLSSLAANDGQAWAHVGPCGAGHFVKMIHNGIEYGAMQAYAEGFALLEAKQDFQLDLGQIAAIWQQGSVVRSWLLDLIAGILNSETALEGLAPIVADSGEGRWTAQEAIDLGVSTPVMTSALLARFKSQDEGQYGERLLAALRHQFGGHAVSKTES